jgi:hypothetical protein
VGGSVRWSKISAEAQTDSSVVCDLCYLTKIKKKKGVDARRLFVMLHLAEIR